MSHFTVLVIGENQEEQLAPFQENNMGDCPKKYLEFHDVTDEYTKEYEEADEETKKEYPTFHEYMTEYTGYKKDKKTGKYGYWENPNKKWDWYELGGRWTGFFKIKKGVLEGVEVGRPGLMTPMAEEGYADSIRKGDIDFEFMRNEAGKNAAKVYDDAMKIIGTFPPNKSFDKIKKEIENIELARATYWAQERCVAWESARNKDFRNWPFGFSSSPDDFLIPKKEYVQAEKNSACMTFAIIKDGKWYERGKMGWWAIVTDEKGDDEWNKQYHKMIDELPDDTLLSVYDCHI